MATVTINLVTLSAIPCRAHNNSGRKQHKFAHLRKHELWQHCFCLNRIAKAVTVVSIQHANGNRQAFGWLILRGELATGVEGGGEYTMGLGCGGLTTVDAGVAACVGAGVAACVGAAVGAGEGLLQRPQVIWQ